MKLATVRISHSQARLLNEQGWPFDWSVAAIDLLTDASVVKAAIVDDVIQGLIEYELVELDQYAFAHKLEIAPHNRGKNRRYTGIAGVLLAFVARESFNAGYDGFVVFVSKTALYDYYIKQYGVKPLPGMLRLHFDTAASERLIQKYLNEEIEYV